MIVGWVTSWAGGTVTGGATADGTVTGGEVTGGAVAGGEVVGGEVTGGAVVGGTVVGGVGVGGLIGMSWQASASETIWLLVNVARLKKPFPGVSGVPQASGVLAVTPARLAVTVSM